MRLPPVRRTGGSLMPPDSGGSGPWRGGRGDRLVFGALARTGPGEAHQDAGARVQHRHHEQQGLGAGDQREIFEGAADQRAEQGGTEGRRGGGGHGQPVGGDEVGGEDGGGGQRGRGGGGAPGGGAGAQGG